jgi:uncharacterized SAM-dependent methyltransferase
MPSFAELKMQRKPSRMAWALGTLLGRLKSQRTEKYGDEVTRVSELGNAG